MEKKDLTSPTVIYRGCSCCISGTYVVPLHTEVARYFKEETCLSACPEDQDITCINPHGWESSHHHSDSLNLQFFVAELETWRRKSNIRNHPNRIFGHPPKKKGFPFRTLLFRVAVAGFNLSSQRTSMEARTVRGNAQGTLAGSWVSSLCLKMLKHPMSHFCCSSPGTFANPTSSNNSLGLWPNQDVPRGLRLDWFRRFQTVRNECAWTKPWCRPWYVHLWPLNQAKNAGAIGE